MEVALPQPCPRSNEKDEPGYNLRHEWLLPVSPYWGTALNGTDFRLPFDILTDA